MRLTEELIIFVAKKVNGTTITHFNGEKIDLSVWKRYSMREAIIKFWDNDLGPAPTLNDLKSYDSVHSLLKRVVQHTEIVGNEWKSIFDKEDYGDASGIIPTLAASSEDKVVSISRTPSSRSGKLHSIWRTLLHEHEKFNTGKSIANIFEAVAEEHLIQPTIIYDFPLAVSPLSKKKPDEPDWVERFEFYIGGFELGNAFSELNDPDDQRARFEQQMTQKERGDDEAHQMDEDYVRALGYGLPPTAGEGIGIDRLTMVLTNSKSIRDVILFPLLRPQTKQATTQEQPHGESAE
jgi:lysyl-tRNA synthetase class 2